MKLLLCTKCGDVFKLPVGEFRFCTCGACKGRYVNNIDAEVSGPCLSLAIGNGSLVQAIADFARLGDQQSRDVYKEQCQFLAWVRPNSGPGNPNCRKIDDSEQGE